MNRELEGSCVGRMTSGNACARVATGWCAFPVNTQETRLYNQVIFNAFVTLGMKLGQHI